MNSSSEPPIRKVLAGFTGAKTEIYLSKLEKTVHDLDLPLINNLEDRYHASIAKSIAEEEKNEVPKLKVKIELNVDTKFNQNQRGKQLFLLSHDQP